MTSSFNASTVDAHKKTNLAFIMSYGALSALPSRVAAAGALLVLPVRRAEDGTGACDGI